MRVCGAREKIEKRRGIDTVMENTDWALIVGAIGTLFVLVCVIAMMWLRLRKR